MRASLTAEYIAFSLVKGKRIGNGKFIACCPAHDDQLPSLSITNKDGKVLFYCFAGCPQNKVLDSLRDKGIWLPKKDSRYINTKYQEDQYKHCVTILDLAIQDLKTDMHLEWLDQDKEDVFSAIETLQKLQLVNKTRKFKYE